MFVLLLLVCVRLASETRYRSSNEKRKRHLPKKYKHWRCLQSLAKNMGKTVKVKKKLSP